MTSIFSVPHKDNMYAEWRFLAGVLCIYSVLQ